MGTEDHLLYSLQPTVEYAVLAMSHDMLSRNRVAKSAKVVGKVFSIVPTSTHF